MKKYINKNIILTSLVCLFPILLGLILFDKLPNEIPIHFDITGTPDNYSSKTFAVFGLPFIMTLINILVHIMLDNDPKKANTPNVMRAISKWSIPFISLIIIPTTLLISLGSPLNINIIASLLLAIMFIIIGNYLPKCKQNYTIGIKLPWTLNSIDNWNKTHRFSGFVFFISGFLMLVTASLKISFLNLVLIAVCCILPILYSFILYKKGI